ncbi:Aminotriazole resistance protein [Cyberlindnera fabianii]|uniref:Aminotriazole resistance protein n=1 Tax=Cyberlindnera fabianii TaxID=36022 RepID=A0A1V2L532_CYBFA|nr:Aminotriazole resistance protein [Cyberlindnera fabianii]
MNSLHTRLQELVPVSRRNKHLSFFLVLLGASLDNINVGGSLAIASSVERHFNTDSPTASWALSAYALTLGSFIILAGKLTDILGPKRVFLIGCQCSAILALICAVIENEIIVLIVFRALQGTLASVLIPSMFAVAHAYYGGTDNMRIALTMVMVMLTSSSGVGLVIGGAFSLTNVGYKGLYYFTFALGTAVAVTLYFIMYPADTNVNSKNMHLKNLDFPGTFMIIVGVLLVILGLTEGGESWKKPAAYVPIPVGFVIILFALYFELVYIQNYKDKVDSLRQETLPTTQTDERLVTTHEQPDWRYDILMILPREAFKITNFIVFVLSMSLLYVSFIISFALEVQYSQIIVGDNNLIAALKSLPLTLGLTTGALLNKERLIYKVGMKRVIVGAMAANVGFAVWTSYRDYTVKNNFWKFSLVPMFLFGFFINTFFGIYINALMRRTPGHLQGTVSGFLQTCGQVGICVGNALVATVLGVITPATTETIREQYNQRFKHAFIMMYSVQAAVVAVLLFVKDQKSADAPTEEESSEKEAEEEQTSSEAVA